MESRSDDGALLMIREYAHEEIDREIHTVSGHYAFRKEARLPFGDREVLYTVGYAVVDRSCCGPGGCGFAIVPGYVVSWKSKIDDQGRPLSQVEPIRDPSARKEVARLIQGCEMVNQVEIW
jgi:hypothetical protein